MEPWLVEVRISRMNTVLSGHFRLLEAFPRARRNKDRVEHRPLGHRSGGAIGHAKAGAEKHPLPVILGTQQLAGGVVGEFLCGKSEAGEEE